MFRAHASTESEVLDRSEMEFFWLFYRDQNHRNRWGTHTQPDSPIYSSPNRRTAVSVMVTADMLMSLLGHYGVPWAMGLIRKKHVFL